MLLVWENGSPADLPEPDLQRPAADVPGRARSRRRMADAIVAGARPGCSSTASSSTPPTARRIPVTQPARRQPSADVAEAGRPTSTGRWTRPRAAFPAWSADAGRRARAAAAQAGRPDRGERPKSWPGSSRSTPATRCATRAASTCPRTAAMLPLFRRHGRQVRGRRRPGRARASSTTCCASRVGVVGQIVPWNFPLMFTQLEDGAGAGRRQHGRAEAGRADAADARCGSPS